MDMVTTKKPETELASEPVKINYTPTEISIIEKARTLQHGRRNGPWIRDASLEVARRVIADAERLDKKGRGR